MPQTNRMNLRYPAGTDTPDVVRDLGFLAADLEASIPRMMGLQQIQAGVISLGDFVVTAGTGMTVNIAAGVAAVPDQTDTYPAFTPVARTALAGLAVTAANASNPRIDQVVMDVDGTLSVLAGTPTSGATLDNRTGAAAMGNGLIRLADILVPAASASVSAGNIRDRRQWARGLNVLWGGGMPGNTTGGRAGSPSRYEFSGAPILIWQGGADVQMNGGFGTGVTKVQAQYDQATNLGTACSILWDGNGSRFSGSSVPSRAIPPAGSHLIDAYCSAIAPNPQGMYGTAIIMIQETPMQAN